MINRNTFYLHYIDKEDLLDKLSSECLNDLEESLDYRTKQIDDFTEEDLYEVITNVFETIQKNFIFYKVMMNDDSIPCFSKNFKEIIRNHISQGYKGSNSLKDEYKYDGMIYIEYIVSGFIGVIYFWLNNNTKYSLEEISKLLFDIHLKNILGILKTK